MFRIFVTISVILLYFTLIVAPMNFHFVYKPDVSSDLPQKSELIFFLGSLRRIVEFCRENKNDLDLNFIFGVFLVNVNLKAALWRYRRNLPKHISNYISELINHNDELVQFFDFMVEQNHDPRERYNKMIGSLFANETRWIRRIKGFDTNLMERSEIFSRSHFERRGVAKNTYLTNLDNLEWWMPHPRLSDMCMVSMASNRDYNIKPQPRCKVDKSCRYMLLNGTNFGYALAHRLLYVLNAKYGRGCSVFSVEKDKQLRKLFCRTIYDEIKYNAAIGYESVDVILEFITLCTIDGHAQFFRSDWLRNILRFQTPYGCFGVNLPDYSKMAMSISPQASKKWMLVKDTYQQNIMNNTCNGHVTAAAAATLSAVVRYILETYYF